MMTRNTRQLKQKIETGKSNNKLSKRPLRLNGRRTKKSERKGRPNNGNEEER